METFSRLVAFLSLLVATNIFVSGKSSVTERKTVYDTVKVVQFETVKVYDTVKVERYIPSLPKPEGRISGYTLLEKDSLTHQEEIELLACYIHTQSIGDTSDISLADKYGIAQVILTQMSMMNLDLQTWLKTKSTTIKTRASRYFWVDYSETYSKMALQAATAVFNNNIPDRYDVKGAHGFLNENKMTRKWKHKGICAKFIHTFYKWK